MLSRSKKRLLVEESHAVHDLQHYDQGKRFVWLRCIEKKEGQRLLTLKPPAAMHD